MILLMPFIFHRTAIVPFLNAFSAGFALPSWLAAVVLLGLLVAALREPAPWEAWRDTLILAVVVLLASPYGSLAGYFIFEHSLESFRQVGVAGREWASVIGATLGGLALAALLWFRLSNPLAADMGALFALTPHVVAMEAWLRSRSSGQLQSESIRFLDR
jgi:hypothetical protein